LPCVADTGSLLNWDKQITSACQAVNDTLDALSRKHPSFHTT